MSSNSSWSNNDSYQLRNNPNNGNNHNPHLMSQQHSQSVNIPSHLLPQAFIEQQQQPPQPQPQPQQYPQDGQAHNKTHQSIIVFINHNHHNCAINTSHPNKNKCNNLTQLPNKIINTFLHHRKDHIVFHRLWILAHLAK